MQPAYFAAYISESIYAVVEISVWHLFKYCRSNFVTRAFCPDLNKPFEFAFAVFLGFCSFLFVIACACYCACRHRSQTKKAPVTLSSSVPAAKKASASAETEAKTTETTSTNLKPTSTRTNSTETPVRRRALHRSPALGQITEEYSLDLPNQPYSMQFQNAD
jgi:hypothetical protein